MHDYFDVYRLRDGTRSSHAAFMRRAGDLLQRADACSDRITGMLRSSPFAHRPERRPVSEQHSVGQRLMTNLHLKLGRFPPPSSSCATDSYCQPRYTPLSARTASPRRTSLRNTSLRMPDHSSSVCCLLPRDTMRPSNGDRHTGAPSPDRDPPALGRPDIEKRLSDVNVASPLPFHPFFCSRKVERNSNSHDNFDSRPADDERKVFPEHIHFNSRSVDDERKVFSERGHFNSRSVDDFPLDLYGPAPLAPAIKHRTQLFRDAKNAAAQRAMATNMDRQSPQSVRNLPLRTVNTLTFNRNVDPPQIRQHHIFPGEIPTPARNCKIDALPSEKAREEKPTQEELSLEVRTQTSSAVETQTSSAAYIQASSPVYAQTSPRSDNDGPINEPQSGAMTAHGATQTEEQYYETKVELGAAQAHVYGPSCLLGVLHVSWEPTMKSTTPGELPGELPARTSDTAAPPLVRSESTSYVIDSSVIRRDDPNLWAAAPGGNRNPYWMRPSERSKRQIAELDARCQRPRIRTAKAPVRTRPMLTASGNPLKARRAVVQRPCRAL